MPHSQQHANRWLQLVLQQPLPSGETFSSHIASGKITSLCTCGCHGFGFEIPEGVQLQPLTKNSGLYCELAFESNIAEEINILLFADSRGYFSGADITIGQANVEPMPDNANVTALIGIWPSNIWAGA
jgi:hypothetical protein